MLRTWLESKPGMKVVSELPGADQVLSEVEAKHPDVMVIDLTMPGASPLEVIREAAKRWPEVRAVVMSGYDDDGAMNEAIEAGAWGLVSKSANLESIAETICDVFAGQVRLTRK